uniref:EGF-like domain-containing protein n=1 Tax=Pelusios castaneus TaxID=367368 RepID=A0A8C8RKU6_9SAUR
MDSDWGPWCCLPKLTGCLLSQQEHHTRKLPAAAPPCLVRMGAAVSSCHTESPVCSSHPCQNNGTCTEHAGEYACSCPPGHSGARCEDDIDECASSPCQNGAICLDRVNEYNCFCVPGFQGYRCEIDINECASRPCKNNGTCLNEMDRYLCACAPGYEGIQCEPPCPCPGISWPSMEAQSCTEPGLPCH